MELPSLATPSAPPSYKSLILLPQVSDKTSCHIAVKFHDSHNERKKKTQALFYYWTTEMICFFKFCSNFQRSYRVCMRRNHQYYYYNLKMSHFLRPYPPQNRKKMSLHPNERKNKHNSLEKHRSNATFRKNVSAKIWSKFQGLQNSNGRLNGPLLPIGVPYLWSWYPYWSFKAYWNFPHILAHFTQRCLVM